jgi:hypothetical protein
VSARRHPWGCTCRTHVDRAWRRSEHWSQADVEFLDRTYGHRTDEALGRHLKRTALAVHLKARRLGLHKRTAGFTARSFAQIFGVDSGLVSKIWIRRGLLPARAIEQTVVSTRLATQGHRPTYWVIATDAPERFIRDHPEWVDLDKMPPSWYRELAAADPWISLPEVHRRTGRDPSKVVALILAGTIRGRRRGQNWHIPVADVPKIPPLRGGVEAIEYSVFCRESVLERRRNRRKGLAA